MPVTSTSQGAPTSRSSRPVAGFDWTNVQVLSGLTFSSMSIIDLEHQCTPALSSSLLGSFANLRRQHCELAVLAHEYDASCLVNRHVADSQIHRNALVVDNSVLVEA